MLAAAEGFLVAREGKGPYCAKLHHHNDKRCIFRHSGPDRTALATRRKERNENTGESQDANGSTTGLLHRVSQPQAASQIDDDIANRL
jgi:hypothetical protein